MIIKLNSNDRAHFQHLPENSDQIFPGDLLNFFSSICKTLEDNQQELHSDDSCPEDDYKYIGIGSEFNHRMTLIEWKEFYVSMKIQRSVRVFHLCHFMQERISGETGSTVSGEDSNSFSKCLEVMKDSCIIFNPSVTAMTGSNKKTSITKPQVQSAMLISLLSCCGLSDDEDESPEIVNSRACINFLIGIGIQKGNLHIDLESGFTEKFPSEKKFLPAHMSEIMFMVNFCVSKTHMKTISRIFDQETQKTEYLPKMPKSWNIDITQMFNQLYYQGKVFFSRMFNAIHNQMKVKYPAKGQAADNDAEKKKSQISNSERMIKEISNFNLSLVLPNLIFRYLDEIGGIFNENIVINDIGVKMVDRQFPNSVSLSLLYSIFRCPSFNENAGPIQTDVMFPLSKNRLLHDFFVLYRHCSLSRVDEKDISQLQTEVLGFEETSRYPSLLLSLIQRIFKGHVDIGKGFNGTIKTSLYPRLSRGPLRKKNKTICSIPMIPISPGQGSTRKRHSMIDEEAKENNDDGSNSEEDDDSSNSDQDDNDAFINDDIPPKIIPNSSSSICNDSKTNNDSNLPKKRSYDAFQDGENGGMDMSEASVDRIIVPASSTKTRIKHVASSDESNNLDEDVYRYRNERIDRLCENSNQCKIPSEEYIRDISSMRDQYKTLLEMQIQHKKLILELKRENEGLRAMSKERNIINPENRQNDDKRIKLNNAGFSTKKVDMDVISTNDDSSCDKSGRPIFNPASVESPSIINPGHCQTYDKRMRLSAVEKSLHSIKEVGKKVISTNDDLKEESLSLEKLFKCDKTVARLKAMLEEKQSPRFKRFIYSKSSIEEIVIDDLMSIVSFMQIPKDKNIEVDVASVLVSTSKRKYYTGEISVQSYESLKPEEWLNDVIINSWINW